MLRRLPFILIAVWAGLAMAGPVWGAEPVFPKGLRVGLVPPAGLTVSTHFPGFEDADQKAAIAILDLPGDAYTEIERSVFSPNQAGMTDVKREPFAFKSGTGILLTGLAEQGGNKLRRWFLVAGGKGPEFGDIAILIKVEVADTAGPEFSDAAIRQALASVTFRPAPIQEQLALLPVKLHELSGFRVMRVIGHDGLMLVDGPDNDLAKHPYVIVSLGRGAPDAPDDRARFSRDLMSTIPLRDITMTSAEPMRIGNWHGFEIRANAQGPDGKPLAIVQWLRFGGGGYIRVIGVGPKDDWDRLFPRFRAVRDGIDLK